MRFFPRRFHHDRRGGWGTVILLLVLLAIVIWVVFELHTATFGILP